MAVKSAIYIDGFNFYYGMVKHTKYKWLDFQSLFQRLRPDDDIQTIRYFTAETEGDSWRRQSVYLRALSTRPKIQIVLGRFKHKRVRCLVRECRFPGPRFYNTAEEKRTDVNIAIHMLDDAYQGLADRIVLVSGDSDLVPALQMVKIRFPHKKISVYIPATDPVRAAAVEIRGAADKSGTMPMNLVKRCQFPDEMTDSSGAVIRRPLEWR